MLILTLMQVMCQFKTIGLGMGQSVRSKQRIEPNSGTHYFELSWKQVEEAPCRGVMQEAVHGEVRNQRT
jgi:hypothetical protein